MIELVLLTGVLLVMFGLVASTEKVLTHRQSTIKIDERMTDHRSRL
ncbi:MAG: hypothetical protein KF758_12180 [Anaerolineales bacterium]|nr:hypothetical protein [Anaerolineales bacterium]MBX3037658.1 hypothetical protein [Anaerolineales bacterium]